MEGRRTKLKGLSSHPLYNVWYHMKHRCYNKTSKHYHRYGGRGITVCKEWKDDFLCFYGWALANGWEPGLTIDRTDNDKGYSLDNVRFIPIRENERNRGNLRLTKEIADKIKKEYQKGVNGYKRLGLKYGTHWSNVRNIIKRGQWA